MKKQFFASVLICVLLSGCGAPAGSSATEPGKATLSQTDETSVPLEASAASEHGFLEIPEPSYVAVSYTQDQMDVYDRETGEIKLLNFTFPWLQVTVSGNFEASEKITGYLRNENSKFIKGISEDGDLYRPIGQEQAAKHALEDYAVRGADFFPYCAERTYHVMRGDDRILCILARDYLYSGGAHGSCMQQYYVFDTLTGERLNFGDMTDGPNGLWADVVEKMVHKVQTDPDFSGRMDMVQEDQYHTALAALIREGSWYLTEDSFCLESQQYELGGYAAGIIEFSIPLEELSQHIKNEYMPEPPETGRLNLTEKSRFLEVDLIQQGEHPVRLSLEADGTLRDFSLFTLVPYANGEGVHKGKTLWSAGKVQNCALGLLAEIPELLPSLGVEFRGEDGGLLTFGIMQSGENGQYFLMELPDLL